MPCPQPRSILKSQLQRDSCLGAGTGEKGLCFFRGRVWGEGVAGLDDETFADAANVPKDTESYAKNGYNGEFYIRFILSQ